MRQEATKESENVPQKGKKEINGGMLPKMELLIIFVFFISFLVWAMSKCSATQQAYEQKENNKTTLGVERVAKKETTKIEVKPTPDVKKQAVKTQRIKTKKITVLYVVLDALKIRKGHHLDSAIVKTLKLNDEVYFLNETTDFEQEINLGDRIAKEPWIKVRAYTGHEGWVYGAGVNYFKPNKIESKVIEEVN